jgi:polyhydroxyalkanoate synthesis regulator phasin
MTDKTISYTIAGAAAAVGVSERTIIRAVKAGELTQKQADAIKQARKQSGHVLGAPGPHGIGPGMRGGMKLHPGPGFPGPHAFGVRGGLFADVAKALGTTQDDLMEQLRDGKSIADVAKANGKSLADVHAAVTATMKTRLDKAVKDGDLTQKQADRILDRISEKVTAIGTAKGLRMRRHHRFHGPPPARAPRPGSFMPGEPGAPDVIEPPDVVMG